MTTSFVGYVVTATDADTSYNTITTNVPAGVANGDSLIWAITSTSGTGAQDPAAITGWTFITAAGPGSAAKGYTSFWKRTAASEPASYTATFAAATGTTTSAVMLAYRDAPFGTSALRNAFTNFNPAGGSPQHIDDDLAAGSTVLYKQRVIYFTMMSGNWLKAAITTTLDAAVTSRVPQWEEHSASVPTQFSGFWTVSDKVVDGVVAPAVAFDLDAGDTTFHPGGTGGIWELSTLIDIPAGGSDAWAYMS